MCISCLWKCMLSATKYTTNFAIQVFGIMWYHPSCTQRWHHIRQSSEWTFTIKKYVNVTYTCPVPIYHHLLVQTSYIHLLYWGDILYYTKIKVPINITYVKKLSAHNILEIYKEWHLCSHIKNNTCVVHTLQMCFLSTTQMVLVLSPHHKHGYTLILGRTGYWEVPRWGKRSPTVW